MPRNLHDRKLTLRHRFRDVSHMKLMNIFKSLRHRRIRRDVSLKSSIHSRSSSNHDFSPAQPLLSNLSTSVSLHLSRYRSHASSIPSITEEDCSSGMSASSPSLWVLSDWDRGHVFPSHSVPNFPTSPSIFQLRSASTKDYLVDRLEQCLGQLHLASPDGGDVSFLNISPRDIPMDVCLDVSSPKRAIDLETSSRLAKSNTQKPMASPYDQNVPMILITSVNAKHAKPLPPSTHRARTPLGPSNTNRPTDISKPTRKTPHDDPFMTQPEHGSAHPPTDSITFRLPAFPLACSRPYAPETPTPTHCDHFGDCSGDLWEIFHPPLVAGKFTLAPFKLPPLSTSLFDVPRGAAVSCQ